MTQAAVTEYGILKQSISEVIDQLRDAREQDKGWDDIILNMPLEQLITFTSAVAELGKIAYYFNLELKVRQIESPALVAEAAQRLRDASAKRVVQDQIEQAVKRAKATAEAILSQLGYAVNADAEGYRS